MKLFLPTLLLLSCAAFGQAYDPLALPGSDGKTYITVGRTTFGSDGSVSVDRVSPADISSITQTSARPPAIYQHLGGTIVGSDGTAYNSLGAVTTGDDGTVYLDTGAATFGSDGSSFLELGSFVRGSDGSVYQRAGSLLFQLNNTSKRAASPEGEPGNPKGE